jgi:hypothetical protein
MKRNAADGLFKTPSPLIKRKNQGGYLNEDSKNETVHFLGLDQILFCKSEIPPKPKKEIAIAL